MIVVSILALILGVIGIGLILVGLPGPRVGEIVNCPKCGYDQTGSLESGCCPECGYDWKTSGGLMHQPMQRRKVILGIALIALVSVSGYWFSLFDRDDWSTDLPGFILQPLARLMAAPPTVPKGKVLPHPDDALYGSRHHWDRTLWRTQATLSFEALLSRVEASGDDPVSLEALVPAMQEAQIIYSKHGGMLWSSMDPIDLWLRDNRERMERLDGEHDLPMGTWVRSELQFMSTVLMPSGADRFIAPPTEIFDVLRRSQDPVVRRYAFDQLTWAWQAGDNVAWPMMAMMDAAEIGTENDAFFEAVISTYHDEAMRRMAEDE